MPACPKAPAPASRLGVAPGPPHVPMAPAPTSRLGAALGPSCVPVAPAPVSRLWVHHVSPRLQLPSLARGGSGATTRRLRSSTSLLAHGSSEATTCPEDGLYKLQAIKQISPGSPSIMISIEALVCVSSKALRDKGCSVRHKACIGWPTKCQRDVWAGKSQRFATVPSGSWFGAPGSGKQLACGTCH
jgi:hypothetical protein